MKHLLVLLPLLLVPPIATAGSVRGNVLDATTLQPVKNMIIAVDVVNPDSTHLPDTTDLGGVYEIDGIAPGNQIYVLEGFASGYTSLYVRIPNLGSLDLIYDILLFPTSGIPPGGGDSTYVSGIVHALTPGSGVLAPVASASVTLSAGARQTPAITDANGKYGMRVPRGSYSVAVSAAGYATSHSTVFGINEHGATVNAILQPAATEVRKGVALGRPAAVALHPAFPDPFNPSTTIRFDLVAAANVDLAVFDILGRRITSLVNGWMPSGSHAVRFDAAGLSSGMYIVRLEVRNAEGDRSFVAARKVTYIR